ncbi:MAG: nucleotidyl transferase AbiEii/AbiGii toxin family protein [Candidatus Omnitrophota bacterium]
MLDIREIESFYPEYLKVFKRNLLREYLQYKILEIIFNSRFGGKLSFMGGTAIRIIHSNTRFSEDLDFDNLGLNKREFERLAGLVKRQLALQGYISEARNVFKGAYRAYLRIPNVLFESGLSWHKEEKILIQLDAEPQNFDYAPDKVIINKFDVFLRINIVPPDILLAQKIYAILKRKRAMGRDFYDAIYLFGKARPNFDYLRAKPGIKDIDELKEKLLLKCKKLDFKHLSKDVEPFLFKPSDSKKVLYFCEYIKSMK